MKTYKIKHLLKSDLLIVELPTAETEISIGLHCIGIKPIPIGKSASDTNGFFHIYTEMFHGYTLLGSPDEIKEEDAKGVIEWGDAEPAGDRFILGYRSYFNGYEDDVPQFTCKTAKESLLSAIESEIYWANPLGDEPNHMDYKFEKYKGEFHFKSESHKSRYGNAYEKWQDAELVTFDRKRSIILKKN